MAKVKFYMDEHISNAVGMELRRRGVDVLAVPEAGMRGASDEDHLRRSRLLYYEGTNHGGCIRFS